MFVFDGAPPQLKRDTLNKRRQQRSQETKKAQQAHAAILSNYLQRQAVASQLQRQTHQVGKAMV